VRRHSLRHQRKITDSHGEKTEGALRSIRKNGFPMQPGSQITPREEREDERASEPREIRADPASTMPLLRTHVVVTS